MGCRQPGPSVRGISHARILVWISISFSATRSMMLGWRTTDAVTVGAHRWPAQRDLPLVVQEMFSLLACDFHNLLRSQEESSYIFTLLQWLSTWDSMPSTLKLQNHWFSLHLLFELYYISMGPANPLQTWKESQGFISIFTPRWKHSLRPGYSAKTWFHNSMFSLLCVKLYSDDVFPRHCAQKVARQSWL